MAALAVLVAAVLAMQLVPDGVGEASPTPTLADRTSAAGLAFVLPTGWDYRLPPEEYSAWAVAFTVAPRIYFSNAAMLDDPICGAWTSLPGAFDCEVVDQLPDDGLIVSWRMRRDGQASPTGAPDTIGGVPGTRTALEGGCPDIGADRAEEITIPDPTGAQNLLLICSRNASSITQAQLEDLLDSIAFTGTATPTPTASPTASSAESPTPTVPTSAPPTMDLGWTTSASFPGESGPAMVQDVVALDDRLVAVGISYEAPLPNLGPTPAHAARAWITVDGQTWEEVELGAEFTNVDLRHLIVRGDGSLLVMGYRSTVDNGRVTDSASAAWTSVDGQSWGEATSGLPSTPTDVVVGAKGYLALTSAAAFGEPNQVWLSTDGAAWEQVRALDASWASIAAGDEGFVITGVAGADDSEPFVLASGDGRTWFEGAAPPPGPFSYVAPRGGDWIVINAFDPDEPGGLTWFSSNGLVWEALGRAEMAEVPIQDAECFGYPARLSAAAPWLVLATNLSGPCSEGGFVVHGRQQISLDGAAWSPLPFEMGTPGVTRSGSFVNAAVVVDGRLILAGERDGAATFWLGEPH